MSEPYVPDTTTPPSSPVTLLDDGDSVTFASLMSGIIAPIWDGIFYLANHIGSAALTEFLAGGPYTWEGAQTWNSDNTHAGIETFAGESAFIGDATFSGTVTQETALVYSLGAKGDADSTIDVSEPVWVTAAASSLRVDTMRSTTAPIPVTGQVVKIRMDPGGAAARRVSREGGTIIATMGNDATDPASIEVYWNGSVWKLLSYSAHVTPGPGA